jgi:hypothetical protein
VNYITQCGQTLVDIDAFLQPNALAPCPLLALRTSEIDEMELTGTGVVLAVLRQHEREEGVRPTRVCIHESAACRAILRTYLQHLRHVLHCFYHLLGCTDRKYLTIGPLS